MQTLINYVTAQDHFKLKKQYLNDRLQKAKIEVIENFNKLFLDQKSPLYVRSWFKRTLKLDKLEIELNIPKILESYQLTDIVNPLEFYELIQEDFQSAGYKLLMGDDHAIIIEIKE